MKLFLIKRFDDFDLDEYDSFVVRAENKENALALCKVESNPSGREKDTFREDNTKIIELSSEGKEQIILGSFNAG